LIFHTAKVLNCIHCKNEYALSNQKIVATDYKAKLFIKLNKLEMSNN